MNKKIIIFIIVFLSFLYSKDVLAATCYNKNIVDGNLKCENYDENNIAYYRESYVATTNCTDENKTNTVNGKLMGTNGAYKMYCIESAKVSFPGNILKPIKRGTYFAWPTLPDDESGMYKMTMSLSFTCTITGDNLPSDINAKSYKCCNNGFTTTNNNEWCRSNNVTKDKICSDPDIFSSYNDEKCVRKYCSSNSYEPYKLNNNYICKSKSNIDKVCPSVTISKNGKCYEKDNIKEYKNVCKNDYSLNNDRTKCIKKYSCCTKDGYDLSTDKNYCVYRYNTFSPKTCNNNSYIYDNATGTCVHRYRTTEYDCGQDGELVESSYCSGLYGNGRQCCIVRSNTISPSCGRSNYRIESDGKCHQIEFSEDCQDKQNPKCTKEEMKKINGIYKCVKCKSGYTFNKNISKDFCFNKNSNISKVCPASDGTTEVKQIDNKCYKIKSISTEYIDKVCPNDTINVGGKCYLKVKSNTCYTCKNFEGYELQGNKCVKTGFKQILISSVMNKINETSFAASLKVDNLLNPIDENLEQYPSNVYFDEQSDGKYVFTKNVSFGIKENKNRFFNRLTQQVTDETVTSSSNIFNRKEGVISTSTKDKIGEYNLNIYKVELGTGNIFGSKINNLNNNNGYTCKFKLTDLTSCKCPSGTKNSGDNVENIIDYLKCDDVKCSKNKEDNTCLTLQNSLCNYDVNKENKENVPENLKNCLEKYYCINNKNVDITSCVKKEVKNMTLEKALVYCTYQNNNCNQNYCYSSKKEDITKCINAGNSKITCARKYGCIGTTCTNYCSGKCENKKIEKDGLGLSYDLCNGKYCNDNLYCTNKNERITDLSKICVAKELGYQSITGALNSKELSESMIKEALSKCKTKSCIPNSIQQVVYRNIDLNQPFTGKKYDLKEFEIDEMRFRTPGYNWNSSIVVKQKILNARGETGKNIYNKDPLLKITLTPSDIKAIREYNNKNSYNNFNLKCNSDDNYSACISYFLHSNNEINLNIEGVNNCIILNASSTLEDYDKCYNSNN